MPKSPTCWSSDSVVHQQEPSGDSGIAADDRDTVMAQKAELIKRIEHKLQILQAEKTELEQEVEQNNDIGQQVNIIANEAFNVS